jgi:hypothetical protein
MVSVGGVEPQGGWFVLVDDGRVHQVAVSVRRERLPRG